MNDEWIDRCRFDFHAAQAIFFVGCSLADLDLRRLLVEQELKEKSFFILKEDSSLAVRVQLIAFGRDAIWGEDRLPVAADAKQFPSLEDGS